MSQQIATFYVLLNWHEKDSRSLAGQSNFVHLNPQARVWIVDAIIGYLYGSTDPLEGSTTSKFQALSPDPLIHGNKRHNCCQ